MSEGANKDLYSMSVEEYRDYMTSTIAFIELWKGCHYALLSNPEYSKHSQKKLLDISWEEAKEFKRNIRQYLDRVIGDPESE
ncbi:hypothetical protein V0288_20840 [Pannus brasiliensis CCIBt3594]|uniref:Uncharacterized protein n=1 Tax=Pannus brasiliensis CCIBt3594 TaxID=1427578 RepID=A0AAW9QY64_9CHRO